LLAADTEELLLIGFSALYISPWEYPIRQKRNSAVKELTGSLTQGIRRTSNTKGHLSWRNCVDLHIAFMQRQCPPVSMALDPILAHWNFTRQSKSHIKRPSPKLQTQAAFNKSIELTGKPTNEILYGFTPNFVPSFATNLPLSRISFASPPRNVLTSSWVSALRRPENCGTRRKQATEAND
jgi:hypothetical protein